jgi:hypothetical protein
MSRRQPGRSGGPDIHGVHVEAPAGAVSGAPAGVAAELSLQRMRAGRRRPGSGAADIHGMQIETPAAPQGFCSEEARARKYSCSE